MNSIVQLQPQPAREPERRPLLKVMRAGTQSAPASVSIRRARPDDVDQMYVMLDAYARQGLLLPRRVQDVYRNVREFIVAVDENDAVLGCGGLRIYTPVLAEIVALAVDERCHGKGRRCETHHRLGSAAGWRSTSGNRCSDASRRGR